MATTVRSGSSAGNPQRNGSVTAMDPLVTAGPSRSTTSVPVPVTVSPGAWPGSRSVPSRSSAASCACASAASTRSARVSASVSGPSVSGHGAATASMRPLSRPRESSRSSAVDRSMGSVRAGQSRNDGGVHSIPASRATSWPSGPVVSSPPSFVSAATIPSPPIGIASGVWSVRGSTVPVKPPAP